VPRSPGYFEVMPLDELDEILDVHLKACWHVTQPAIKVLQAKRYGRVVMISSTAGMFGLQGQTNYNAAKGGVFAFGRSLALENAIDGIKVNTVCPYATGVISRERPLAGRDVVELKAGREPMAGRTMPEMVAPLVTYLASRECAVSGEGFSACAGRFARIFVGVTSGWLSHEPITTCDEIGAHIDEIRSTDAFVVPTWVKDEVDDVIRQIVDAGIAPPAPATDSAAASPAEPLSPPAV
jgi:NAD(P)-dependent dehydrogenase (short-subunit alcohol dehydrogenase family)